MNIIKLKETKDCDEKITKIALHTSTTYDII